MKMFDYIFYRVYRVYKKRDSSPEIYATNVLAVMQFFFLLSLMATIRLFVSFPTPGIVYILPGLALIIALNWYKYGFNIDVKKLDAQWKDEDRARQKRRGWLLVISLITFILFPIIIGIVEHNFP